MTDTNRTSEQNPNLWETLDELIDRYGMESVRDVLSEIEEERNDIRDDYENMPESA
jgi:hypothetical protein